MPLSIGDPAPAFRLPDQDGKMHTLEDERGRWVLLYFYPKDDTSGCTAEACGLRDSMKQYAKANCTVFGVSADSVESHRKFAEKYSLPFPLLADETKEIINAYGVWQQKSMYGKKYMGIVRMSFLIDPKGKIAKIYPKVSPEKHADDVLRDLGGVQ